MRFIFLLIIFGVFKDICHGCETGYYFDSTQCQRCPSNCSICSSVTSCTVCKVGKYGTDCSSLCPNNCHDNVCNIKSGICLSCEKGYFSDRNNACVPCPGNCTTCSSGKYCFACKSGFRGVICNEACFNCQYDTGCDKNSGYCFVNCKEGLSGELCNIKCDSKCKSCERLNEQECISCTDDENGKPCKEQCLIRCLNGTCNESDGSEDLGEYTGNQTCVSYCEDTVCNITSKALSTERPHSFPTTKSIGVILGPVIGSIVIIGACICIILERRFITKRRSFFRNSDDKRSSTPNSNGKSGEANVLLQPPTTGEEGKPKTQEVQSDKQTESWGNELQQSKGANTKTSKRNCEEAAALLQNQTRAEPSMTTCFQTSETSNLVKGTFLDENKRSQEECNSKEPTVQPLEQTKSCDGIFQQTQGAKLSNSETNQNKLEFKELHTKQYRKGFLRKETQKTTWMVNPAKMSFLEIQGTLTAIEKKYRDMKMHVVGKEFSIEGNPGDVNKAIGEIHTEYIKIYEKTYDLSKSNVWLSFCTEEQTVKYVQEKLEEKCLVGTWDKTDSLLRVYVKDEDKSEKIKDTILESILEESVPVEMSSNDVLNTTKWGDLLVDINRQFINEISVCTSKHQEVLIVGTHDAVHEVTQLIKDFLNANICEAVM